VDQLEAGGMLFVGKDETGQRMEALELTNHPFYCAVQYHPEYLSRPLRPSPPYVGLLLAASGQLEMELSKNTIRKKFRALAIRSRNPSVSVNLSLPGPMASLAIHANGIGGDDDEDKVVNESELRSALAAVVASSSASGGTANLQSNSNSES